MRSTLLWYFKYIFIIKVESILIMSFDKINIAKLFLDKNSL